MTAQRSGPPPVEARRPLLSVGLAGALLGLAVGLAYANSLHGVLVYDDLPAIPGNPTLRSLASAWHPPPGLTVSGRPLLNLSLALNYALSGEAVWSYHLGNVLIHVLAALALFGVVRRTLAGPRLGAAWGADATPLALAAAACWALHPLQTEAVDYIVQRTEALMGLCYLLALYGFARMAASGRAAPWAAFSVAACALGMASKEVMVSAPVMILAYDRIFVSGTLRAAWRRRRGYYLALAATWVILALSVAATGGNRNGTKGFDIGVSWTAYALTQLPAFVHYLRLTFWPQVLAFNYAPLWVTQPATLVLPALLLAGLLAAIIAGRRRAAPAAYCGAWFLVLLAPASLVPGTGQMIVEHRLYLSLAAVAVLGVTLAHRVAGRAALPGFLLLALLLGGRTFQRNADYRSALALWGSSAAAQPADPVSHCNYGMALAQAARLDEAVAHYRTALALAPNYPEAHYNLGVALARLRRPAEAAAEYRAALQHRDPFPSAHANLGLLCFQAGKLPEAIAEFRTALAQAEDAEVHGHLANALYQAGDPAAAFAEYRRALALEPGNAEIRYNLGTSLLQSGQAAAAADEYRRALAAGAHDADTHYNLALAEAAQGDPAAAAREFAAALDLQPGYPGAAEQLRRLQAARP